MPLASPPRNVALAVHRRSPGVWSQFLGAANQALGPHDVVVTSWWRSPSENDRVGGSGNSQHLLGLAFDVAGPGRWAAQNDLRRGGFVVVDEGDHVHAQVWPAGVGRSSGLLRDIGL